MNIKIHHGSVYIGEGYYFYCTLRSKFAYFSYSSGELYYLDCPYTVGDILDGKEIKDIYAFNGYWRIIF